MSARGNCTWSGDQSRLLEGLVGAKPGTTAASTRPSVARPTQSPHTGAQQRGGIPNS